MEDESGVARKVYKLVAQVVGISFCLGLPVVYSWSEVNDKTYDTQPTLDDLYVEQRHKGNRRPIQ